LANGRTPARSNAEARPPSADRQAASPGRFPTTGPARTTGFDRPPSTTRVPRKRWSADVCRPPQERVQPGRRVPSSWGPRWATRAALRGASLSDLARRSHCGRRAIPAAPFELEEQLDECAGWPTTSGLSKAGGVVGRGEHRARSHIGLPQRETGKRARVEPRPAAKLVFKGKPATPPSDRAVGDRCPPASLNPGTKPGPRTACAFGDAAGHSTELSAWIGFAPSPASLRAARRRASGQSGS